MIREMGKISTETYWLKLIHVKLKAVPLTLFIEGGEARDFLGVQM